MSTGQDSFYLSLRGVACGDVAISKGNAKTGTAYREIPTALTGLGMTWGVVAYKKATP